MLSSPTRTGIFPIPAEPGHVSAFAGIENIREACKKAVGERYRFCSYGDAMLII
jgi:hypothetical protein